MSEKNGISIYHHCSAIGFILGEASRLRKIVTEIELVQITVFAKWVRSIKILHSLSHPAEGVLYNIGDADIAKHFLCKITFIQYELNYLNKAESSIVVLYMIMLITGVSLLFSAYSMISFNDWKKKELKNYEIINPRSLLLDWIIILIQPYVFFDSFYIWNWDFQANIYMEFKINYVLVILSLIKLYLIVPCIMNILRFKNPRFSRVCKMYGCSNPNIFELKCHFRAQPIKLMASMFIVLVLFFSFAFRVS